MTLPTKQTLIELVVPLCILAGVFYAGRYTAPETVRTEAHTETVDHVITKTVTIKEPSGTVTTTTEQDALLVVQTDARSQTTAPAAKARNATTELSGFIGADITRPLVPVYGAHLTKEVLGPLTIGAWGLTNGTIGLSLGVRF